MSLLRAATVPDAEQDQGASMAWDESLLNFLSLEFSR
jgi:hypothetical protein